MLLGRLSTVLFLAVLMAGDLCADVVPGRWEKVEALDKGYALKVNLRSGETFKASYEGLSEQGLLLKRTDGNDLEVPRVAVLSITSQKRISNDGLRNGAIIGAVAGGAFALTVGLAGDEDAGLVAAITALYSAIGMGAGVGIDAIIPGHEVLYRASRD